MTGRGHVVTGTAVLAGAADVICVRGAFQPWGQAMRTWLVGTTPVGLAIAIGALGYYLGLLLPDADSPTSAIGKYFYVPVKHRTWLHAMYVPLAMIFVSMIFSFLRPLFWCACGYLVHLWVDSMSTAGICWWYPYPGYRLYDSGAFVKKGAHPFKLYKTGERSEIIVCCVFCIVAVILWAT